METAGNISLDRLFASPPLSGPSARGVKYSPDGKRVTFLKSRAEDAARYDLWQFDVATGAASMLVDSKLLDPNDTELSEAEKATRERKRIAGVSGIVDYDWGTATSLLVPMGGDLHLVDISSGAAITRQLTRSESYETDARVSPSGRYVSFIRDNAVYAIELANSREFRVSPAAEPDKAISYGVAEFVAQEEMDRFTGYWWSPDDRYIAFTRVNESGVEIIPRFDIAADKVTVIEQRYPRAGEANAIVDLFVHDLATGQDKEIIWRRKDWGADSDQYLARVHWGPPVQNGQPALYTQAVGRDQGELDLNYHDISSRSSQLLYREEQASWINLSQDFQASKDEILFSSEASGFRHVQKIRTNASGERFSDAAPATRGNWPVRTLLRRVGNDIYFSGFSDTPLEQHLYRMTDAPDAAPQRITEAGKTWTITLAPDAKSFVGVSSSPAQPPRTGLYAMDGRLIAWIEENAVTEAHPYAPYLQAHVTPEFGTLTAEDGQTLHYSLLKPPNFDPRKKYPVIQEVYGGPGVQTVVRDWGRVSDQFYVQQGYIVFRLDNRGSTNRGKAFEAPIHLRMGTVEVSDQLRGTDWLKSQSFIDPERVAIQGWSYGGYMTLMTILKAPKGTYAAAVSGAPVTDWRFYDTYYTERYMSLPQTNLENYDASSVFPYLDLLETPLMLVHGMADDNVTFDNTTRLMAALQEKGKPFEVMTYPGQRHGIRGEPLQKHLMLTRMNFLNRHLKNAP